MKLSDIRRPENLPGRLSAKIDDSGNCWLWTAGKTKRGYGKVGLVRTDGRHLIMHASRAMYLAVHGEVPDGLAVCHTCDTPLCCRPSHLFVGTQTENLEDMTRKGRRRYGPHRGEDNGRAKLTWTQVMEIRARAAGESHSSLARAYNVASTTVDRIVSGVLWRTPITEAEDDDGVRRSTCLLRPEEY